MVVEKADVVVDSTCAARNYLRGAAGQIGEAGKKVSKSD